MNRQMVVDPKHVRVLLACQNPLCGTEVTRRVSGLLRRVCPGCGTAYDSTAYEASSLIDEGIAQLSEAGSSTVRLVFTEEGTV